MLINYRFRLESHLAFKLIDTEQDPNFVVHTRTNTPVKRLHRFCYRYHLGYQF